MRTVANETWFMVLAVIVLARPLYWIAGLFLLMWNSPKRSRWAMLWSGIFLAMFIARSGEYLLRQVDPIDRVWTMRSATVFFCTQFPEVIALWAFTFMLVFKPKTLRITPRSTAPVTVTATATVDVENEEEGK